MGLVLLVILVIAVAVPATTFAVNFGRSALDSNRKGRVASDRALGKAERALRSIANGAGNPALEAQIALDEITAHHDSKELN